MGCAPLPFCLPVGWYRRETREALQSTSCGLGGMAEPNPSATGKDTHMPKRRRSDLLTILAVAAVLGMAFLGVMGSSSTATADAYPLPTVPAQSVVYAPVVLNQRTPTRAPPTPGPSPTPGLPLPAST